MKHVLEVKHVKQAFKKAEGKQTIVLDDINLTLNSGEITGLLGKSGSGKSTLLRVIAGLITPTEGDVKFDMEDAAVAMVFQSFALFPWLTVLQNVELGLEAQGLPPKQIRKRALEAIDLIGLDGYESAYPRELSGGMKQRVGFARALVVNPAVLLMDEPFSALDVLTAETLKTDFLDLWIEHKIPLKTVLIVTHNIEEAVLLSDRILIFSSNPGRIVSEIKVDIPHPRDRQSEPFRDLVERIYATMMARMGGERDIKIGQEHPENTLGLRLPRVSSNQMAGLMEALIEAPFNEHAEIANLVDELQVDTDELLHIIEALRLLKFVDLTEGEIHLNVAGKAFADGDTQQRKKIFAEHVINNIPLAAYIKRTLNERPDNKAPRMRFLTILEDHLSEGEAQEVLNAAVSWGRYAELYSYNDNTEMFNLENPTA